MEKAIISRRPILLYLLATALVTLSITYFFESAEEFGLVGDETMEVREGGLFLIAAVGSATLVYWFIRNPTGRRRYVS
jgi:hypothetical protein